MDPGHRKWPLDQRSAIFSQPVGVRDLYWSSTVDGCLAYDGCDGNPLDVTQMAKWAEKSPFWGAKSCQCFCSHNDKIVFFSMGQTIQPIQPNGWIMGLGTFPNLSKTVSFSGMNIYLPTMTWGSLRFTRYHSFDPDGSIVIWGQTLRPLPGLRSVAWCCWSSADCLAVRDSRNSTTVYSIYIIYNTIVLFLITIDILYTSNSI